MKTENIEDIYELSPIQKGILFQSLYDTELGTYFFQVSFSLRGQLNVEAFDRAWQLVVARHTALRTGFYWENLEKPLQVVYRQVKLPVEQYDWRLCDDAERQKRFKSFLESDRHLGFDLSQECLMRLTLLRLEDEFYQLIWSHHFIILDGWSAPLMYKDFVEFYEALRRGKEVPFTLGTPYRNYIEWLQKQDLSKAEIFWRQSLSGVVAPTPLTNLNVDNSFALEERYDEQRMYLSQSTTAALQSLARQHQLTPSTLFQGAWAMLLSRYSCRDNVVYGCTVSGRPADLVGVESMVGLLINTLPVQVKVDPDIPLMVWLRQFQAQLVEMRQYEYTPLVDIQGWSKVSRSVPLFESILVFENLPVDPVLTEWKGDLEVSNVISYYKTNYPLTIAVYPGAEICIAINYDFRRFECATIIEIQGDFERLLQGMVTNPDVRIQDLLLLADRDLPIALMLERQASFDFRAA